MQAKGWGRLRLLAQCATVWKCHFLGPVSLVGPMERGGTIFTGENLK